MAVEVHPILLNGNWDIGYALDQHVIRSVHIADDPFGNPVFDTTYSEIGELLTKFKYKGRYDNLTEIVSTIEVFLRSHPEMMDFETIIPVPPTKFRPYQPTWEICEALAKDLNRFFITDVLVKESGVESKGLSLEEKRQLSGTIRQQHRAKRKHSVLLIDDLYKTGATLSECVSVLRRDPQIDKIYVLTVTKTKNPS